MKRKDVNLLNAWLNTETIIQHDQCSLIEVNEPVINESERLKSLNQSNDLLPKAFTASDSLTVFLTCR